MNKSPGEANQKRLDEILKRRGLDHPVVKLKEKKKKKTNKKKGIKNEKDN